MIDAIPGPEPRWLQAADASTEFVVTICSRANSLDAAARIRQLAPDLEIGQAQQPATGVALFDLSCSPWDAWSLYLQARVAIGNADFYLRPRRQPVTRLLICDMDMTIVAAETLDEVAAELGFGDEIAAITARAMHGELDFDEALRERIAMLAGQPEQVFHDVARKLQCNPGAGELIAGANAAGVRTILISGGFAQVAEPLSAMLGFDEVHCNRLDIDDGRLTGRVPEPIINADLKCQVLVERAQALGIRLEECCAIGDGANDKPMLEAAGLGIAYRGKPVLRAATNCQINVTGLDSALWFMGLAGAG